MHRPTDNDNQPDRGTRLIVVQSMPDPSMQPVVPPHLTQVSWIDHEQASAMSAFKDLRKDLKALKKKVSANRVHKARVTLRRWFSIWKVMRKDGWLTKNIEHEVEAPLKRLQELLGSLRDLDVNDETGHRLGCSQRTVDSWTKMRKKGQVRLEKFVKKADVDYIMECLGKHLKKRAKKIRAKLPRAKAGQSAYAHIDFFLLKQESIVKELAETAHTPEELHELRLSIKRWRYLLTEFFGVTNLDLVRAQQLLGQMHDLDRLTPLLVHDEEEQSALEQLKRKRRELLAQVNSMRPRLPYGLRPQIMSVKAGGSAPLLRQQ